MKTRVLPRTVLLIVFSLTSVAAGCGDDSDNSGTDGGGSGKGGSGAKGGGGGKGGSGGGNAGSGNGGSSATGGAGGSGGAGGGADDQNMCTEEPPSAPVKCGDETCVAPDFPMNPCVVPCCLQVNGKSMCAARSTSNMFQADCTLPPDPDPDCAAVDEMPGCCDHIKGKCGFISEYRPGCTTESTFVTVPDKACSKSTNDNDAGPSDGDAG